MELNEAVLERFAPNQTWDYLVDRVSSIVDGIDRREFSDLLRSGTFIPAGQILRGAGTDNSVLYNCFVAAVDADEEAKSIAERISSWTRLGCGVGVNVTSWIKASRMREATALASVLQQITSSQQELWDSGITRTATMVNVAFGTDGIDSVCATLNSNPRYRHINLGVLVDDATMKNVAAALADGGDCYDLQMFTALATRIWEGGNPGLLFIDRINAEHPFNDFVDACNPCAEQHLSSNEGCNLGSLNLATLVEDGVFRWDILEYATRLAVRFLDRVIDCTSFPCKEAALLAARRRRIGLGVTGLATALDYLGVAYDTDPALELSAKIAGIIQTVAADESCALGRKLGYFADFRQSRIASPRRNSYLTSIAPAGAISLLWNVSSGIEPFFGTAIKKGHYSVRLSRSDRSTSPKIAQDIDWSRHLQMLAIWQSQVDAGISKTVNIPGRSTVEDIMHIVIKAWQMGCKGVSVFRENSRQGALEVLER